MAAVVVVKRKLRPKTGEAVAADSTKYADPSHACEKAKNPLSYVRASYTKALRTKVIWGQTRLTARHIRELFGEPTRILQDGVEYVFQIPTREVVKIEVSNRGVVSVHGFQRTPTLERWFERLMNA